MAKKKNRLGDDPFDVLLPHIQDTRKKKVKSTNDDENVNDDTSVDVNNDTNKITSTNKNENNDDYKNNDVSDDVYNDVNVSTNNYTSINDDESTSDDVSDDDDANVSTSIIENSEIKTNSDEYASNGAGAFTIPKKTKIDNYVRMTHYFRPDQLQAIDDLHEKSGRDKSELVRIALDILIERAKVE